MFLWSQSKAGQSDVMHTRRHFCVQKSKSRQGGEVQCLMDRQGPNRIFSPEASCRSTLSCMPTRRALACCRKKRGVGSYFTNISVEAASAVLKDGLNPIGQNQQAEMDPRCLVEPGAMVICLMWPSSKFGANPAMTVAPDARNLGRGTSTWPW